jgi:hypothetical protein
MASAGGVAQQSFRFRPPVRGRPRQQPGSSADVLVGKVQIGAIHNKTCAQKERATSTAALQSNATFQGRKVKPTLPSKAGAYVTKRGHLAGSPSVFQC